MVYFWISFSIITWLIRICVRFILEKRKIPVVFLGETNSQQTLIKDLQSNSMLGYKLLYIYKTEDDKKELLDITKNRFDVLYVYNTSNRLLYGINEYLHFLVSHGTQFMEYSDFYEYVERKIPPEDINESWFLSNILLWKQRPYFILKRFADIILSLIGLVITIWLWPLIALIIHLDSNGPVFFIQEREGRGGKRFHLYKFRSMYIDKKMLQKLVVSYVQHALMNYHNL